MVAPLFGVLDVQESGRVEVVGLPTAKLPGAVGAVATFTVVVAVTLPFGLVAVMVYIVVLVGFTFVDPMRVLVLKLPGVIATEEAFVIFQERALVPAEATTVGDAEKEEMVGRVLFGITLFEAEELDEFPAIFVAFTVKVYDWPFVRPRTEIGLPVEEALIFPGLDVAV